MLVRRPVAVLIAPLPLIGLLAVLGLAPACGGSSEPVQGIEGTQVLFVPPGSPESTSFFDFPWPSDIRLAPDGSLDLAGFPNPDGNPFVSYYLDGIARYTKRFGTNSGVFFRVSAPIDSGSLPTSPEDTLDAASPVFLVDVDPDSPDRGSRVPVLVSFRGGGKKYESPNLLAVVPVFGFPLRPSTTYACGVLRSVTDLDGSPLGSPLAFERVKRGRPEGDPFLEGLADLYEPLLDLLEEGGGAGGPAVADLAAATVFTTGDPVSGMRRIRDFVVRNLPEPEPSEIELLGAKSAYALFAGRYETPNFQTGLPPYAIQGGEIQFEDGGDPVLQYMEDIRFALTVPNGTMPASGWPIVVYAHGTGGDYRSFERSNTARVLAEVGIAAIGIDQPLHGERVEGDWSTLFFNPVNLLAGRDNNRQSAADSVRCARLARRLRIPGTIAPGGAEIRFDPDRVYFMGHSQGGTTGPLFLGVEPDVRAAVLSGSGGSFILTLLQKSDPFPILPIVEALLGTLGRHELDEFHPIAHLLQSFIEPAEPLNYAPLFFRKPAGPPKNIFLSEGLLDLYVTPDVTEALAVAAGLNPIDPVFRAVAGLDLRGLDPLSPPVAGNAAGGMATSGLLQFPDDGHFAIRDNETAVLQFTQFLATMAEDGIASIVAGGTP